MMNWKSGLLKVSSGKSSLQRQTHKVFLLSCPDTYRAKVAHYCWSMRKKEEKGSFMIKKLSSLARGSSHDAVGRCHSTLSGEKASSASRVLSSHVHEQQSTGKALSVVRSSAVASQLSS